MLQRSISTRGRLVKLGCLGATLGLVIVCILSVKGGSHIVKLPPEGEVKSIVAKLNDVKTQNLYGVAKFALPREYFGAVIDTITPARKDTGRNDWENDKIFAKLGELEILTTDGRTIVICLYDVGKTVAGFKVDGVQCFREGKHHPVSVSKDHESYEDESVLLYKIVVEISHEQETKVKSERLGRYLAALRRSIGEIPPERRN